MDSNPICHPSPAKKMKCSFLDYVQLLMIRRAGWSTRTPSATLSSQKKWNAHFWITFNFWWSGGLVDGLDPICHPSPATKMKSHFWITFNFWWSTSGLAGLVDGLEPCVPPLCRQKNEMLSFRLHSTSDDWPAGPWTRTPSATPLQPKKWNAHFWITFNSDDQEGWLIDSNPICHPSPAKKWNAHFWITFNFWWSGGLVDRLKSHLPPLSSQKKWNAHFWITFNFWWSGGLVIWPLWTWTPFAICHPLQPQKWNAHFWITFNSWWLAGLVDGHEPCVWPLCSQKTEMLIFGLCSTSDDWLGWLMDSNLICHPSPAKRMKCLFLDYLQLLMIGQAGQWTRTPSTTSLQPKKWNAHFWITFNFWWLAGLVDGLEPCVWPLCSQKNEMLIFGLRSTSDDWPGWSMDSNPICHPSPAKKIKCSF